jgi:WD40 repeat protein
MVRAPSFPGRTVLTAALSPDGKILAVGTTAAPEGQNALVLFDTATYQQRASAAKVEQPVARVVFAPDGKRLAAYTGPEKREILLCEVPSGRELRRLDAQSLGVRIVFAPDGKTLVAGQRDGTIVLFNPDNGSVRGTFAGHSAVITELAYAPDGRTLATADIEGTIKLWWVGK